MAVKIENQYEGKLPRNTLANVESALASVPREHLPRRRTTTASERDYRASGADCRERYRSAGPVSSAPGESGAWFEVAIIPLTSANKPFHKRIIPRLSFKGNLSAVIFSLIASTIT